MKVWLAYRPHNIHHPRELQNLLAKYEEHLQTTIRFPTREVPLEAPGPSTLALPGDQDISLPERMHALEVSPATGAYAHAPWCASPRTYAVSITLVAGGWSDAISRNGGPTSYAYRRPYSLLQTIVLGPTLDGAARHRKFASAPQGVEAELYWSGRRLYSTRYWSGEGIM